MKQLQEMLKPYFAEWQTDYDITAVHQFIFDKVNVENLTKPNVRIDWDWDVDLFMCEYFEKHIWNIPQKPLHLYSDKEEQELLELLTKLNND